MPKISIITPAYNCEKYLPDAVKSVLSQTFTDWELLIIDDCSKDNTYRYMKKLAENDKRIRIFQNKVNSGSAATRNYGVRLARGELIYGGRISWKSSWLSLRGIQRQNFCLRALRLLKMME